MSGALYNGQRFYWVRDHTHDIALGRTGLVEAFGEESGVLR